MNLLNLPSIVNLANDRRLGQKRFVQNQSQANHLIQLNHKNNYDYNEAQQVVGISTVHISDGRKVKFNQNGANSRIQGKILEEQLMLRNLQSEYDMERSRIQDQQNAKNFRIRYPYGKENVKITEDVLEKYRANTFDQTDVLKKFQEQAKQRKQYQKSQRRLQLQSYRPNQAEISNDYSNRTERTNRKRVTSILERQKKKMYLVKQKYLRQVQKSKQKQHAKHKQDKRIANIQCLLKDMKNQLDQNFSMMTERQNQKSRQKRFIRQVDLTREKLQQIKSLDNSQEIARRKLPVVVYNGSKHKDYNFVKRSICTDLQSLQRKQTIEEPKQFDKVLKIYNLNKIRLDRLCQRVSLKCNKSSIIY